jgi:thioredoxin 1
MEKVDKEELSKILGSDKLILIDLSATWCGPCQMMAPIMHEIDAEYGDKKNLKIVNVDIDESPEVAAKFNVMSVPTFLFVKGDKVLESIVGAVSKDALAQKIDNLLKKEK